MAASALTAVGSPEDESPASEKGIFTGLVNCYGHDCDVTVHAASIQQAINEIGNAYPIIKVVYPGRPKK